MPHILRRATLALVTLFILTLCALAAPVALGAPVTVTLRVEGSSSTIFEGPVTSDAKTITKDASGPHPCDGTNGGASTTPGPTLTSALDDASATGAFTWAGTYFNGFDDFAIDRIGPDASTATAFWGYALNYVPSQVGGCQQKVQAGDEVLFAYDFFSKTGLLKLSGPSSAETGRPVTVKVVDGQSGAPVAGASVGGELTSADGTATLVFPSAGIQRLKASRASDVRSNSLSVCVHAGEDGTCGTAGPSPAPGGQGLSVAAPVPYRAPDPQILSIARRTRFRAKDAPRELRGRVNLGTAGLTSVRLALERRAGGRCEYFSGRVEAFRRTKCGTGWSFAIGDRAEWSYLLPEALAPGRYELTVYVRDRTGQRRMESLVFFVKKGTRR